VGREPVWAAGPILRAMKGDNKPPFASFLPRPEDGRRHGRIQAQVVACSLGEVLDISGGGMRVTSATKPEVQVGDELTVTLQSFDGPLAVMVRVVWSKRRGFKRHQLGLQFVNVGDDLRKRLSALARALTTNEIVRPSLIPEAKAA